MASRERARHFVFGAYTYCGLSAHKVKISPATAVNKKTCKRCLASAENLRLHGLTEMFTTISELQDGEKFPVDFYV